MFSVRQTLAAFAVVAGFAAVATPVSAQTTAYVLTTTNNLYAFNTTTATTTFVGALNLGAGINPYGIDFRGGDGNLYALGSNGSIYQVNRFTAAATVFSTPAGLAAQLTGAAYSVNFNPVPNALRIVGTTDASQNLRITNTAGTANLSTLNIDGNYPAGVTVSGTAYTNTGAGLNPITTTQYILNDTTDTLHTVTTPNAPAALPTVGALSLSSGGALSFSGQVGFDIFASLGGVTNTGYVGIGTTVYSLNLSNAVATSLGSVTLASGDTGTIKSLSLPVAAPEPGSFVLASAGLLGLALARRKRN